MGGKLAAFAGSTPNIGTSLTAYGTAHRIASLTGRKVGFLCLNLKSAKTHLYLGIDKPDVTLDGVRPELRAGTLTGEKLRQYAFRAPGPGELSVLFGNLSREQAEYYEPEDMSRLLAAAREAFDLTVADVRLKLCGQNYIKKFHVISGSCPLGLILIFAINFRSTIFCSSSVMSSHI